MTTSPTIKLSCGTRTLDLTAGRYRVDDDFVPPPYAYIPLISTGTSANKSGGALIDSTPTNRNFAFGLHVSGSSDAEVRRAVADLQMFLSLAGDESAPLYLVHKQNSDTPEPLWGNYGANIKYEILTGTARVSDLWAVSDLRARGLPACQVNLLIKPHAVGLRQRLGSALGGIIEDNYGASDGVSRGLIVPEATTNLFTNPVFGNATYSTNWTVGSNLTAAQNTDTKWTLPGCLNSMRVYARNTTNNTVTESLTLAASSHTITAYVMLPDLTAPTSTQLQIYYNSAAQTTTYEAVGDNGLYRCYATVTGTGGALATGVVIKNKYTVYLLGMQVEAKAYPTPLAYGDLLGHSWSGTAHASTSARAVARMRVTIADDTFFRHQGTIALAVKFPVANTHPNDNKLFFIDTSNFQLAYVASSDTFQFYDGANAAVSAAKTFSPGQVYILHCVWQASGLNLYVNGASDGTNATFTPVATGSAIYIGSDATPANNAICTFLDFRTFDRPLTATEVSNDYANVAQVTADNQRVGCIPWLWTKDGDDVVDNCDDSTRDNWAVCGGVPGSAEAVTRWKMTASVEEYLLLANLKLSTGCFARPDANGIGLYVEGSGTAGAASDSNTDYKLTSVTTSSVSIDSTNGMFLDGATIQAVMKDLYGKEFFVFCRLYDEGSNLTLNLTTLSGTSGVWTSPSWAVTTTAAFRGLLSQMGVIFPTPKFRDLQAFSYSVHLQGKRTTGTANVRVDFVVAIPRPFFVINSSVFDSGTPVTYEVCGQDATSSISRVTITGDEVHLSPEKTNLILSVQYGETLLGTWTNTFDRVDVTPRFTLL